MAEFTIFGVHIKDFYDTEMEIHMKMSLFFAFK